ncbi:MAG: hypothetical protein JWM76_1862 [Pseudonocardiales bacterium]|nr:hypothetical protein [Pseudonocardiales bacterium]
MKIRGHGSWIAIALAGLAVVIAASGTAYAVTASTVNIADPTTPTRIAHVDSSGRLLTSGSVSVSTIDSAGYLYGYTQSQYTYITSPTTANLALTRIRLSNPGLNGSGNQQQIALHKVNVDAAGKCSTTILANLGFYNLAGGQETVDPFVPPLSTKATGTAKYCLALYTVIVNANPTYYLTYSLTAYVASGTYTGLGSGTAAVALKPEAAKVGTL